MVVTPYAGSSVHSYFESGVLEPVVPREYVAAADLRRMPVDRYLAETEMAFLRDPASVAQMRAIHRAEVAQAPLFLNIGSAAVVYD